MKILRYFNVFTINVWNHVCEKCGLSAQNDVNFGCENIASESNFSLAYKIIVPTLFPFVATGKKKMHLKKKIHLYKHKLWKMAEKSGKE